MGLKEKINSLKIEVFFRGQPCYVGMELTENGILVSLINSNTNLQAIISPTKRFSCHGEDIEETVDSFIHLLEVNKDQISNR